MRRFVFSVLLLIVATSILAQITGVSSNGKYFVDAQSRQVGKVYDYVYWNDKTKHGVFYYTSNWLHGVVDQYGNEVIPAQFSMIDLESDKLILVQGNKPQNLKGAYNYKYQKVYDLSYDEISVINPSCVELRKNGKYGIGNLKGEILIPFKYDYMLSMWWEDKKKLEIIVSNGGFWTDFHYINGKTWGVYINNKMVVPCEYDSIMEASFEDNIYMVMKNGKWGYYGNDRELIPPQYDAVTEFVDGVATVRKDGELKLIKNPLKDGSKIMIAEGGASLDNKKQRGAVVSRYPKPESDVDKNIPVAQKQAENTFAFIICNENYADAPVPYSLNDGRMFKEYCQKSLGLPEKNINMYEDATFGNIITAIEKMKSIADAYDGEASVIFYYAGHGFPDDKQQTAYLLPIDGDASSITTTGYPLAKLYEEIAGLNLKSSIVFLDACFSGAKREDQMLASSRGVAIKVKEEAPQGKMVVFSAAQGDETAHQLEDMHHGLFTYYLLKGIQNAGGDPDMGTLTEYVTKQVKRQSVVINNKKQTPTVIPSQSLSGSWQTMKLR